MALPLQLALAFGPILLQKIFGGSGSQMKQIGQSQNFDPQRAQLLKQYLGGLQSSGLDTGAYDVLRQQMQPFNQDQYMQFFNQGVVQPTLRNYQEDVIPSIIGQSNQGGMQNTGSLNRAIGRSAENLSQGLGSLRAQYLHQGEQNWRNDQNRAAAQALGLFQNATGGQNVSPLVQNAYPSQGMEFAKALAQALGPSAAQNAFSQWFQPQNPQQPNTMQKPADAYTRIREISGANPPNDPFTRSMGIQGVNTWQS